MLLGQLGDYGRQRGFEIGALTSPLLSKQNSNIVYVDRLSTEALRAKFANDAFVDINRIVHVDVVLNNNSLCDAMSQLGPFDYAIASHVIEHVPNVVVWLSEIAHLVRVGGRLVLVIPDKRYTFDFLRGTSSTSSVVAAWIESATRPDAAQIFDFNAYAAEVDKVAAWAGLIDPAALRRYGNSRSALQLSSEAHRRGEYIDCHCWVFTPASLLGIFAELVELGIMKWKLAFFADTRRDEEDFGLVLERVPDDADPHETAANFRKTLGQVGAGSPVSEAETLRGEVTRLQLVIESLRGSRSWRTTEPLRRLSSLVRGNRMRVPGS